MWRRFLVWRRIIFCLILLPEVVIINSCKCETHENDRRSFSILEEHKPLSVNKTKRTALKCSKSGSFVSKTSGHYCKCVFTFVRWGIRPRATCRYYCVQRVTSEGQHSVIVVKTTTTQSVVDWLCVPLYSPCQRFWWRIGQVVTMPHRRFCRLSHSSNQEKTHSYDQIDQEREPRSPHRLLSSEEREIRQRSSYLLTCLRGSEMLWQPRLASLAW